MRAAAARPGQRLNIKFMADRTEARPLSPARASPAQAAEGQPEPERLAGGLDTTTRSKILSKMMRITPDDPIDSDWSNTGLIPNRGPKRWGLGFYQRH